MNNFTKPSIIWITGASTGIGEALSYELALCGHTIIASARSAGKLQKMAEGHYGAGSIKPYPLDVTQPEAVKETVAKIIADFGFIDVAILNAGGFVPDGGLMLDAQGVRGQFDLNFLSVMDCIASLMPHMTARKSGHIAAVASVAGYRGLPASPAYSASKAAVISMMEALRPLAEQQQIKLQLICPGFVKTPLTDRNRFPMPFLISAERAAQIISQGLQSPRFEIVFPWQMAFCMKILRILPYALFLPLMRRISHFEKK